MTSHKFIIYAIAANVELELKAVGEKLHITEESAAALRARMYRFGGTYTLGAEPGGAAARWPCPTAFASEPRV